MSHRHAVWSKLILCLLLLSSCVKDKPADPDQNPPGAGRRLLIINEGSLSNGNASLSVYLPEKDSVYNQVFWQKNKQTLGDIFQSITVVDDRLFLAINNSDKIVIAAKDDFSYIGQLQVSKPRNMLLLDSEKMYVSSLFHPEINIINPKTLQLTGHIAVDYPNTEGLLLHQGSVYACNWDTACSYLYQIDPQTDQIVARIELAGKAPQQVLADKQNNLWVLGGNVAKQCAASLTHINLQTGAVTGYTFPAHADMMKPTWNAGRDTLFMLGVNYEGSGSYNGVFRTSIHTEDLDEMLQEPFISAAPMQYFWALAVDSLTGHIFIGDPKGFIQQGDVLEYDAKGKYLQRFAVGVGPGAFLMLN